MNSFSALHLSEPLLEFAGNGRHVDVRFGLMDYGPVDFSTDRTKEIRLGVVGSSQTVGKLGDWLKRCEGGIPAKNSRQPNLFPAFPGSTILGPFRCSFNVGTRHVRTLSPSLITRIVSEPDDDAAVALAVDAFANEVRDLAEQDLPPQVVICALPVEIIERVSNMRSVPIDGDQEDVPVEEPESEEVPAAGRREIENFRGALKAKTLELRVPIQIVWPTTYDNDAVVKRKLAELSTRKVQDEATRAWNFFCSLYYKSGGTPWRMVRDQHEFSATFMGVSFFEGLDGSSLQTSSAQLFDERGEGLILKGGPGLKDKIDRQPYLSSTDAFDLTRTALQSYKRE